MCKRNCVYRAGYINGSSDGTCEYSRHRGSSRTKTIMLLVARRRLREQGTDPEGMTDSAVLLAAGMTMQDEEVDRLLRGENCPLYRPGDREPLRSQLPGPAAKSEEPAQTTGRYRKREVKKVYIPPANHEKLLELYRQNMSDREIANELGIHYYKVTNWRKHNGLPGNVRRSKLDPEKALALHRQGLSDPEIARALGCCDYTILKWRTANGIPTNCPKNKLDEEEAMRLYREGLTDPEIGDKLGCHNSTIWSWRDRNGLPANYRRENKKT